MPYLIPQKYIDKYLTSKKEKAAVKYLTNNTSKLDAETRMIFEKILSLQKIAPDLYLLKDFILLFEKEKDYTTEDWNNIKKNVRNFEIRRIKMTFFDLTTKFSRFSITEISEKSGIKDESLIIKLIVEMIRNKEIYAEYFDVTKSVVFDQQANMREIDKLLDAFKEWEQEHFEKKE